MVVQADSTLAAIRQKVRRLTASASESSLTTDSIDQYINTYYSQDFPYSIKTDQMRSVYTFYTSPYIDKYPININYNQGIRTPVYVDGIRYPEGFFKDREQFYNIWPRFPTLSFPIDGDGVTQLFSFTSTQVPFLRGEVTLGGTDIGGGPIRVSDDGSGNLLLDVPNPIVSVPTALTNVPGMKNLNTANPGDLVQTIVGTVDYLTGAFTLNLSIVNLTPADGTQMNLFVSQYQTGRPYSVLFWNNYFIIRPVPKLIHKIELESYMTPVQFMNTTDNPIVNQWWQLIAIGAALKVLEDRQDMEGMNNLAKLFDRQEALVLERQATEEIGQRNVTIFEGTNQIQNFGYGQGWW